MIREVWHFSFTVRDMSRSLAFYRDLLGMEVVAEQEQANAYTRRFVGFADAHLRVVQLRIPEGWVGPSRHILELVQYFAPLGKAVDTRTCNPGTAHLAFIVDDLQAEHRRLKAAGVRFVSDPVGIEAGVNRGGMTVYAKDPDGIIIELVQPPSLP